MHPSTQLDALAQRGGPSEVLVLGRGTGVVANELRARGRSLVAVEGDWPSIQLPQQFELVVIEGAANHDRVAVVHCAVQHTAPGGHLGVVDDRSTTPPGILDLALRFDLAVVSQAPLDGPRLVVLVRSERRTIHDMVFEARARLRRVTPPQLAERLGAAGAPLVVDTRTHTDRVRFGVIAGSIHVPRTVVEWHLDPANGYRHPAVESFDQPIVLVCNGGYSSSLAAVNLLDLGFSDVTDLIGGHRAWVAAGLPTVEPDHSHLDL